MQTYLVLLHEGTTIRPVMSPEEMQAVIARYKAWGQRLHASGRLVSSNKLENDTGRVLRSGRRPNPHHRRTVHGDQGCSWRLFPDSGGIL